MTEPLYGSGSWDESFALAEGFVAEIEAGSPHYLAPVCYMVRGEIRLGRGEPAGAIADLDCALELAVRAVDPQTVLPIHARAAHVHSELGNLDRAASLLDPYLAAFVDDKVGFAVMHSQTAALTAFTIGRGPELASALADYPQPWARAARAHAGGDPLAAAAIAAGLGAVTLEAFHRLAAARQESTPRSRPRVRSRSSARSVRRGTHVSARP